MDKRRTTRAWVALTVILLAMSAGGASLVLVHRGWDRQGPLEMAREAYRRGDYSRAADLAREHLAAQPSDPEGLLALARPLARLGRLDSAIRLYNNKLTAGSFNTEDSFLLGQILAQSGQLDGAMSVWEKAAAQPPGHPEMLDSMARLNLSRQRIEEGTNAAQRLSKIAGWEARGFLIQGTGLAMMDDWEGSVEALKRGLELDRDAKGAPNTPQQYRKMLARGLLQLGRAGEVRSYLQEALAQGAGADDEASWLESRADIQERRFQEAASAIERSGTFRKDHPLQPEPSPYRGSASCRACHLDIDSSYKHARHARTFHRGDGLLALPIPDQPLQDPQDPKVTHTFDRVGKSLSVRTKVDDATYKVIVDFAFGTTERYQSMIGRDDDGAYRALRLSHYHDETGSAWGATSGDVGEPDPSSGVRGQKIHVRDGVVRCLGCHVTNPRDFRNPSSFASSKSGSPTANDSAIGCEGCHGPGGNHIEAVKGQLNDPAIINAGRATSASITADCGRCHVVGDPKAIERDPTSPQWVRSAALTLTFSRCYNESAGTLSCLTCHDPHRDAVPDATFYEAKCVSCHSASKPPTSEGKEPKICKVNPTSGCMNCHMPKVPVPLLHTSMTDHYIRIRDRDPKPAETGR